MDPVQSPYNGSVPDYDPQTLPMDEVIRLAISAAMLGLRVSLPAQVTKVLGNQLVNVQPTLQIKYIDQSSPQNMKPISNVPVGTPKGAGWSIKVPIAVGDTGLLVFADRSLDVWLAGSGGIVDPQDGRTHDLSDAVFYPGLGPTSAQTTDSTSDMVLTNGLAVIRLEKAGKFKFTNGTNEVINLLVQITDQLKSLANTLSGDTVTVTGVQNGGGTASGPLAGQSTYASIKTTVNNLETLLNGLAG